MTATTLAKAGLLSLATAGAALTMTTTAIAAHATARPAATTHQATAVAAKSAHWYTLKHGSFMLKGSTTRNWNRKYGRVMQVEARCWGNDATLHVQFQYRSKWTGWHNIKSGSSGAESGAKELPPAARARGSCFTSSADPLGGGRPRTVCPRRRTG
ncbi:hypothetical protein AB0L00_14940 [Actinoallomurus sp. NPDC052308]|uniref:hypothetical protein n=1 Tax=Actinoallomurus sp. NPDC052308 TaxID=3155530 RepID=UPI00343D7EC1